MGAGGATWDTAGTLELGSGNTFNVADATEDGDFGLLDAAWWVFTPAQSARIVLTPSEDTNLILYVGGDHAGRDDLAPDDFEGDGSVFNVQAGTTYHVLVAHNAFVSPTTYQVTWTQTILAASPWISTLRDRDDNQLIVTKGDLLADNPPAFQTAPDWFDEVFGTTFRYPPSRRGNWGALQALGGPLVTDAIPCVWSHAWDGDGIGSEGGWDGTCSTLGTGPATFNNFRTDVYYSQTGNPDPGGPVAESVVADIVMRAEALWFGAAQDHMTELGVLASPDPVADGYPADATLEWEGDLELLEIEITPDFADSTRPADGSLDATTMSVTLALRREVAPDYLGGDPFVDDIWEPWTKGDATAWDGDKTDLSITYTDGPSSWVEVDGAVDGDTGWDAAAHPTTDAPNEVVAIGMTRGFDDTPPDADGVQYGSGVTTAVRFTFRSPRYRWVYEEPEPGFVRIPPRRITHRPDGLTQGSPRVQRGGNTRQSGSRTLGSIL